MKHIQAANYTPCPSRDIDILVVHDMEAGEYKGTAEAVAGFFHNQPKGPNGSSANACFDVDSAVSCVWDHDIPWAAPFANHNGWHGEFAGFASQSKRDWLDAYSEKMIFDVAAPVYARKAIKFHIPAVVLGPSDLKKGRSGITTHAFITEAFGPVGGHTDPGKHFPLEQFVMEISHLKRHMRTHL